MAVGNDQIERDLKNFNLGDVSVSSIKASLEDVFVRLTTRDVAGPAPTGQETAAADAASEEAVQ